MAFRREEYRDYFLHDTSVENLFINEYMPGAPGEYVKVYLFSLMYADLGVGFSNEEIAKHLSMEPEDVYKAWNYWEQMGIVKKIGLRDGGRFDYDIEFLRMKEKLYGEEEPEMPIFETDESLADEEIRQMFKDIEKVSGRMLNSAESSDIISWIGTYGATPELITYAFEHSASRGKSTGTRYVQAIVSDWAGEGLKTAEDVEKHLAEEDKKNHLHRRIFRALGFTRNATEEEKKIMDSWFEELGFNLEQVLEACAATTGISSPNIKYVNKILINRSEENGGKGNDKGLSAGEIMKYYEALRAKEEAEAENRRKEVYREIPRVKEIESELNKLNGEISGIIISDKIDKRESVAAIKDKMDNLNAELAALLTDGGFEIDYMDVKYTCEECHDTGILDTGERCQCFWEIKNRTRKNK